MCRGKIVLVSLLLSSYCRKDAVLAAEAGCEGIVLSNHGGEFLTLHKCERDLFSLSKVVNLNSEQPIWLTSMQITCKI